MIKQLKHILFATLAIALLTLSCVEPFEPALKELGGRLPDNALALSPTVLGSTIVTKADEINAGIDEPLHELIIETLDVYVYTIGTSSTSFFKRYHFISTVPDGENSTTLAAQRVKVVSVEQLSSGQDILLETDWKQAGYDQEGTQKYRIYTIANSRISDTDRWKDLSEADLKAMTITSKESHSGSYDIVRPRDVIGPGNDWYNIHIKNKNFLMDGMIDNWSIALGESQQYFTKDVEKKSFSLTRAAAKFLVNVSFKESFIESLASEGTNGTIITEAPQFKFSNFMPTTFEITPGAIPPKGEWRDNHIWSSRYQYDFPDHNPSGTLVDNPASTNYFGKAKFSLTTYSYSFAWDNPSEGAVCAPAIVLRVYYKTDDLDPELFFYRIPLVDLTKVTSIDRNYLYVVDAEISSKGAIIEDIKPMDVNLNYKVVPWPNVADVTTEAQSTQLQYFVAETEYRLRGNGEQFVYLQYFTPKSDPQSTSGSTTYYKATPKIQNVKVYYFDQNGTPQTLGGYNGAATYSWDGSSTDAAVSIEVQPDASGGHIYVNSTALDNRSVKYIEFEAVVDFSFDEGQPITRKFTVTHFPLDNLQNIEGKWSSYWNGRTENGRIRTGESSTTHPSSWGTNYETETERIYCTYQQYTAATGAKGHNGVTIGLSSNEIQTIFEVNNSGYGRNYNAYNTGANSVTTAKFYEGKYYWVTRSASGYGGYTYTYYVADTFWTERTIYYRTQQGLRPSTGNWIDWDASYNATTHNFNRGNQITDNYYSGERHFRARVFGSFYNRSAYVFAYNRSGGGWGGYTYTLEGDAGLTNNHMYIVQISKANNINLGRPTLDNNSQSNDNTVSPAFMIASQLGATTYATNSGYDDDEAIIAAQHCRDYMEVASNGRRFVEWRLPTKAEIAYILQYQDEMGDSDVFSNVITGHYYYTLNYVDGEDNNRRRATTTFETSRTTVFTRCIRDLTPEEVIELNTTGTITDASYPYN